MIEVSSHRLGLAFSSEIRRYLSERLGKIEYQANQDIDLVAQKLLGAFDEGSSLNIEAFGKRVHSLRRIEFLSPETQISLNYNLDLTMRIFDHADQYVAIYSDDQELSMGDLDEKTRALQQLIIHKIRAIAQALILSGREMRALLLEYTSESHLIKDDRFVSESKIKSLKNSDAQQGIALSDHQLLLLRALNDEVQSHQLAHLRNPHVDLFEDTPLIKELLRRDSSIYGKYSNVLHFDNRVFLRKK